MLLPSGHGPLPVVVGVETFVPVAEQHELVACPVPGPPLMAPLTLAQTALPFDDIAMIFQSPPLGIALCI